MFYSEDSELCMIFHPFDFTGEPEGIQLLGRLPVLVEKKNESESWMVQGQHQRVICNTKESGHDLFESILWYNDTIGTGIKKISNCNCFFTVSIFDVVFWGFTDSFMCSEKVKGKKEVDVILQVILHFSDLKFLRQILLLGWNNLLQVFHRR